MERYVYDTLAGKVYPIEDGYWVKWEDVEKIIKENERLREQIDKDK